MNKPKTKSDHRARRHLRIRARLAGSAECPRLVVFRSLRFTYAQLVDDVAHKVLASVSDHAKRSGSASKKTKVERAKEIGKAIGEKALAEGLKTCVFDRNGYKYHGRVQAVADGAREAGLVF